MLLATGQTEGGAVLIVGLSAENVRLLQEGRPILRDLRPLGIADAHLAIHAGATDQEVADAILSGKLAAEPQPHEELHSMAKELGLGATGQFPHGKVSEEDQGELKGGMTIKDGKIIMAFGKSVAWLAMTGAQARGLAASLLDKADKLDPRPHADGRN